MKMNTRSAITAAVLAAVPAGVAAESNPSDAKNGIIALVEGFLDDATKDLQSAQRQHAEDAANCQSTAAALAGAIEREEATRADQEQEAEEQEVIVSRLNASGGAAGSISESAQNIQDAAECVAEATKDFEANNKQITEIREQNRTIKNGSDKALNHLQSGSNAAEFHEVTSLIQAVVEATTNGNNETIESLNKENLVLAASKQKCIETGETNKGTKAEREAARDTATAAQNAAQAARDEAQEKITQKTTEKQTSKRNCDAQEVAFKEQEKELMATKAGLTTYKDIVETNWNGPATMFMQLRTTTSTLPGEHASEVLQEAAAKISQPAQKQQLLQLAAAAAAQDDKTGTSAGAADAAAKVVKVLENFAENTRKALDKLKDKQGECQVDLAKKEKHIAKLTMELDQTTETKNDTAAKLAAAQQQYEAKDAELAELGAQAQKTKAANTKSKQETTSEHERFKANRDTLINAWQKAQMKLSASVKSKVQAVHDQLVATLENTIAAQQKIIDALQASIEENAEIANTTGNEKATSTENFTQTKGQLTSDIASLTDTEQTTKISLDSAQKAFTAKKEVCMTTKSPDQVAAELQATIDAIDEAVKILNQA